MKENWAKNGSWLKSIGYTYTYTNYIAARTRSNCHGGRISRARYRETEERGNTVEGVMGSRGGGDGWGAEGREAVICNETQQLQSESMHGPSTCMQRKRAILPAGPVVKNSVFVQAETADMKPAWRMLTNSCRAAPPYKCRVLRSLSLSLSFIHSLFLYFYPASPFVITARRRKGFRVNEREAGSPPLSNYPAD